MEKVKKTIIKHLNLDPNKRLLFMSDIHGDIKLFKEALKKVNFSKDDYLFVIGDMIEKGDFLDNKLMLDFIINFSKEENVFFMAGNCDEIFRFIMPPLDKKKFLYYALVRQKSIINDLAEELKVELNEEMDIDGFIKLIGQKHPEYYAFIDELPDVIFINDTLVLVHGGIADINNISNNSIDLLKFDRFLEISNPQPKVMIVGHYPTRNYHAEVARVDPIFDVRKNIISIDGGNNLVKGGQINVVILDSLTSFNFSYVAVDHYPKYQVKEDIIYAEPKRKFNIRFGKNEVNILTKDLDFYYIKPISSDDTLWVHEDFIFEKNGKYYCYDGSNTFINLKKGDTISVIKRANPYSLIKHDGVIGLIESKYIHEDFI